MEFKKVTLTGSKVLLEPLSEHHRDGLCHAVNDGELWKLFVTSVPKPSEIDVFISEAINLPSTGQGLAFAVVDQASGSVVGSTRFMNASIHLGRTEIGFTFISKSFQQTYTNTESKLLLLTHAFEVLNLNRIEFMTDYLNITSRNAILRIGAKQEGILRNHMRMPNGRVRDSVIFSVIKNEWPGVKQNLLSRLV
ncbi:MAG: GNAT family N-acetyltransferase [Agarilytica sp.]